MKKYLPLLANLVSQVLFGFAYLFMKMGMAVVNQNTVKFLLLIVGLKKVHYKARPIGLIVLCGLFNPLISQILETTSTTYAPTSQIAMYNSILPVIMLVFSALINHEYPTRRQFLFVLVTVLGVFITTLVDKAESGMTTLGLVLIIATMLAVSINRVLVRRASAQFSSFEIIYLTTGMGAVAFTGVSLGSHALTAPLSTYFDGLLCPEFAIAVLYMGIGSCVCAFLLMTYASANLPFAVYASTCTLSTVVGILSGVFLLHEVFLPVEIVGTIVILAGIIGISFSYDKQDAEGNKFHLKKTSKSK